MNQKDIMLFVTLKKLKPHEVQVGLKFFRRIKIEQMRLKRQQLPANEQSNPSEAFHITVARMSAENKVSDLSED